MNTVALCIPAYNAAGFLPRLLSSAVNQTIPFDEILVYDDCSSDNTAEVAESYGATVIKGDINRGCSFGKNALAGLIKSDWIHFHDADDELLPNFTTLAHQCMNDLNCPDVVLFDYEWRDNDSNELLSVRHFEKTELEKDAMSYAITNQINPFCGLYRKSSYLKVGGYDVDPLILYNEDKAFHIKLAKNGLSFSAENEISIVNYRRSNSMSGSNSKQCVIAQYHVLEQTSVTHGKTYGKQLADQVFDNAASLAKENEWAYVKKALLLSKNLGHPYCKNGSPIFNTLTRFHPFAAIWLRERLIRLFKPHLRTS